MIIRKTANRKARWRLAAMTLTLIATNACSAPQGAAEPPSGSSGTAATEILAENTPTSDQGRTAVTTTSASSSLPESDESPSETLTPPMGVEVSPAPIPEDEALARYLKDKALENQLTDPPSIAIVRRISPDERRSVMIQCLEDAGFPVTETGPLGYRVNYPPEQADAYHLANYTCAAQYPLENKYLQDPGLSYYVNFYHYEVDVTVPCLEAQGYPQTDPIPTLQTYLSELGTQQEWHAINVYAGVQPPKLYDLQRACPQLPPIDTLLQPAN